MALVDFEKWLDDKIDFFKKKGTVVLGSEVGGALKRSEDHSSDSDDYGDFEMAEDDQQNQLRRSETLEEFSLSEPEYEFDDSDLKGSEYYRFVFNELEDDDEDEIFDRASHLSLPKSGVAEDATSYQDIANLDQDLDPDQDDDLDFSGDQVLKNSYNAVKLAQKGAARLHSLEEDANFRLEGDGESLPGSFLELSDTTRNGNNISEFSLAQISDESGSNSRYHRKSMKSLATLPMDSTYLSMDDESNDDDLMLQDVRFDDYEGTQVPADTRPIMVTEQTLREIHEKRRKLLKNFALCGAILIGIVLIAVTIYLIFKLAAKR